MGLSPFSIFTALYKGILSKCTICLKFQLKIMSHPAIVAMATCKASFAYFVDTIPAFKLAFLKSRDSWVISVIYE
jgi:hypothetical protein